MDNKENLFSDSELDEINLDLKLKSDKNKFISAIGILIIVNTLLYILVLLDLGGDGRGTKEMVKAILSSNLLGYNVLGFILGTIFALIPYKGLPYAKKYVRASLLVILTIHVIQFIALTLMGIGRLMGVPLEAF